MSYTRVTLIFDCTAPIGPVLKLLHRFSPALTHLHVVALAHPQARPALTQLQLALEATAVDLSFEECFDLTRMALSARRHGSLVVVGPWPSRSRRARALAVLQLLTGSRVDVLAASSRCELEHLGNGRVCLALEAESAALVATAAAVRELPRVRELTLFLHSGLSDAAEPRLRALFPAHALDWVQVGPDHRSEPEVLGHSAQARGAELLVIPSADISTAMVMRTIFSGQALEEAPIPVLILHHRASPVRSEWMRLSASDAPRTKGQPLRVLLERGLGRTPLAEGERFLLVGAEHRGPLEHEGGVVLVPEAWVPAQATALGFYGANAPTALAPSQLVGESPLVLLDARFPLASLVEVEPFAREHTIVVARLRPTQALESIREAFATAPWGGPVPVLDASALLDDGGAGDVSELADPLRLLRLAQELLVSGVPVAGLIAADGLPPSTPFFATWTASTLQARSPSAPLATAPFSFPRQDVEARWEALTQAPRCEGHQVTLELENTAARKRLLSDIGSARRRVHFQSFMVDDDPVSEEVALALRAAAARGVEVRVLVDALYSLHGAFGTKNPVLERLGAAPGVEVRAAQPLSGLPRVVDLKQRNHRKLCCIDGQVARVTGRNLGAPYYRGFDEVQLVATTSFHEVPWLDAGVVLEGPLVEAVDRAFLADWQRAEGDAFEVRPAPPAGGMACRLILHQGLLDVHSLNAQLELVRTARRRLVLVNTFPFALELQRALIRAVKRGVQVQCLFGSVRPRWGEEQPFSGGAYRTLGDELVRARLSPVLHAGAQGFQYTVQVPSLGPVFSHVHAKLFVRDDDAVAVGSANLDVTSAYFESEVMLCVHDASFVRDTLLELDALLATARPVDLTSGSWKEDEARRDWLSRNWPTVMP